MSASGPLAAAALLLGACAAPASPQAAPQVPAVPPAPAPGRLSELDWLYGTWRSLGEPFVEETWTLPAGDMLLGSGHVVSRAGRTLFFEHMRIERTPDALVYVASPRGRSETSFTATRIAPGLLRFENPAHDDPRVIEYRLNAEGRLVTRVEGARVVETVLQRVM